jgi:hypothetical protein
MTPASDRRGRRFAASSLPMAGSVVLGAGLNRSDSSPAITARRLVDTDDTKTMKTQHPHNTEGM